MSPVISLKTAIPGPASQALTARRTAAIPRGVPATTPIAVVSAENAVLTDADGNRFIDFGGGIGVVNAGHRHPGVVQAIREQLDHFTHVCFPVSMYEPYIELAEKLNALVPGKGKRKTFLVNSGAEAVENAVKVARRFTGRQAIVAFEHGFHGRTYMGMSLTAKVSPYKQGFGPFSPEIYRLPFPDPYRAEGAEQRRYCDGDRAALEHAFYGLVDPGSVAAIILELQVGEGGFIPAPKPFIATLAQFCKDNGILFIDDEIQTGFGRTGRMFAAEHYGLEPDIVTTAKSLAGGLPLAAITGRADVMDAAQPGGLGGTYGGNPLACAAALAVLEAMESERIPQRADAIGERIRKLFLTLQSRYKQIGDVRGLGAMIAIELVSDPLTKAPSKELTAKIQAEALKRGLILLTAGTLGNVVRVLVPLTVEDAVLEEGLTVFEAAVSAALG
jgi:4-aminobutyrate aminotransferase/(S)-3-amino-2-methylpropionate transaminase